MEINEPANVLDNLQKHFVNILEARLSSSAEGQIKTHRDTAYTENPMEREDIEESVKVSHLYQYSIMLRIQWIFRLVVD